MHKATESTLYICLLTQTCSCVRWMDENQLYRCPLFPYAFWDLKPLLTLYGNGYTLDTVCVTTLAPPHVRVKILRLKSTDELLIFLFFHFPPPRSFSFTRAARERILTQRCHGPWKMLACSSCSAWATCGSCHRLSVNAGPGVASTCTLRCSRILREAWTYR